VAEAGRLRVGVDRATRLIHAAGVGVVLTLIAAEVAVRDLAVSDLTREAILAAVTTDAPPGDTERRRAVSHAVALKAVLPEAPAAFTSAERGLLAEWLDRLIQEP